MKKTLIYYLTDTKKLILEIWGFLFFFSGKVSLIPGFIEKKDFVL